MKRFTIILFLSLLIINPSQAQRGWRSFDQFGFVHQIYQSADDSLWVTGVYGVWRLHDDTWQQVPHASVFVFEDIILAPSGSLDQTVKISGAMTPMVGNKNPILQEGQLDIGSVYEDKKGTLWVAASWAGLWRYGADSWQLIPQVIRGRLKSIKTGMAPCRLVVERGFGVMRLMAGNCKFRLRWSRSVLSLRINKQPLVG